MDRLISAISGHSLPHMNAPSVSSAGNPVDASCSSFRVGSAAGSTIAQNAAACQTVSV
jgi:hypothetical protein